MRRPITTRRPGTAGSTIATGRLQARSSDRPSGSVEPGLHQLETVDGREALLLVPPRYRIDAPVPFVLSLHGAGGTAEGGFYPFRDLADRAGIALLSPASHGPTWDIVSRRMGPDVAAIDELLGLAFARVAIDPARTAIAGFSDGASYALSVGLANGNLFPAIMAFSPGFAAPPSTTGEPRIFIAHGTRDAVLPIDPTSRHMVPMLEEAGYDVTYREFDGPHAAPEAVAVAALDWFLGAGWLLG